MVSEPFLLMFLVHLSSYANFFSILEVILVCGSHGRTVDRMLSSMRRANMIASVEDGTVYHLNSTVPCEF